MVRVRSLKTHGQQAKFRVKLWPDTALEFTNRKESKESIEIIKRSPQVSSSFSALFPLQEIANSKLSEYLKNMLVAEMTSTTTDDLFFAAAFLTRGFQKKEVRGIDLRCHLIWCYYEPLDSHDGHFGNSFWWCSFSQQFCCITCHELLYLKV